MRHLLAGWLALVLLIVVGLLGAGAGAGHVVLAQSGDVAVVDPAQGLVQVYRGADRDAGGGWITLTEAAIVSAGDTVRTDVHGLARLVFFEGVEVEILPNSMLIIDELSVQDAPDAGPFAISLGVMAGETLHRVNATLDADSRYRVHTPSAVLTVRGTEFWTSAYPMGETQVRVLDGVVAVTAVAEDGRVGDSVEVEAGNFVTVVNGELGEVLPLDEVLPDYPESASLALISCGNGICEPLEAETDSCPEDCLAYSDCGDGICDWIEGENALVCPSDCAQNLMIPGVVVPPDVGITLPEIPGEAIEPVENTLHFLWATMSCEYTPSSTISGPLLTHWGVGCFDSYAHASAHPHPADYQMFMDGELMDMGTLRQSGPHLHPPYCPVGWTFTFGPVTLPPGEHTLRLVETITDTWSTVTEGVGGRNAGETVELSCVITVE